MAQHDYVIANGTGAAVRSDLNNALAAIVSQNSGATEPATMYAYQFWADTTTGLLKLRNAANNAWITLFQLDGEWSTLAVENGTAAAPSIYFKDSGTDTGFYSSGTDALDFTTAGTRRLGISSSGDIIVYGGNTTLNDQGDLRFADSDSSNWVAFQGPATVSSNVTWTLPSTDGTSGQVLSTNGSGTLSWATASGGASDKISEGNTEAEVVDTGVDGHFKVTTEGTERLRVDSSGRALVGTSSARTFVGGAIYQPFQVEGANNNDARGAALTYGVNNTAGPLLSLAKHRSNSIGGSTVVVSGDELGGILFQGADGTNLIQGASIYAYVDGTPGANDMPGRLIFATTADGASSPTERMRITSTGQLRLAGAGITFNGDTATANELDDYEEGTWTATLQEFPAGGTTTATGRYTKTGRYVHIQVRFLNVNLSTWTGNTAFITGAPFTSAEETVGSLMTDSFTFEATGTSLSAWIEAGTQINLYASQTNATKKNVKISPGTGRNLWLNLLYSV